MRFQKFKTSALTEVFTKQDWDYFNNAYSIGIKDGMHDLPAVKAKRGRARKWIIDVLDVFAMKLDITFGQAKQLFELGNPAAIRDIYARVLPGLREQLKNTPAMRNNEGKATSLVFLALEEKIRELTKMSEMDGQDAINAVRAEWTRALSIQHPAFERHLMSGKSSVRQGEESKVQGKRGSTPIVESKNPKRSATQKALDSAAA